MNKGKILVALFLTATLLTLTLPEAKAGVLEGEYTSYTQSWSKSNVDLGFGVSNLNVAFMDEEGGILYVLDTASGLVHSVALQNGSKIRSRASSFMYTNQGFEHFASAQGKYFVYRDNNGTNVIRIYKKGTNIQNISLAANLSYVVYVSPSGKYILIYDDKLPASPRDFLTLYKGVGTDASLTFPAPQQVGGGGAGPGAVVINQTKTIYVNQTIYSPLPSPSNFTKQITEIINRIINNQTTLTQIQKLSLNTTLQKTLIQNTTLIKNVPNIADVAQQAASSPNTEITNIAQNVPAYAGIGALIIILIIVAASIVGSRRQNQSTDSMMGRATSRGPF